MQNFLLENWEIIQERNLKNDFIPMQVSVYQETEVTKGEEGLLQEKFDTPIEYASGPRTHRSADELRVEQKEKIKEEQILANQISLPQEQLEQMLSEAYDKGRQESGAEAEQKYQEQLQHIERKITAVINDLAKQEQERLEDIESSALNLSLQISKKIIEETVEINPEYILQVLREALHLSGGAKIRKIRVSPQDLEFINLFKVADAIKEFDGSWEFEADEGVKAGCILESSAGSIDFQLDKSWERIKDKILSIKK
jgi:flagellar biosynthesis/type III secretory pathway protein FliH